MKNLLKLAVSIGLLLYAIMMLDAKSMLGTLQESSPRIFAYAIVINIITFTVMGLRWYLLASSKLSTSLRYQLAIYFKAIFFNTFTPANLGGDAYRLMDLKGALGAGAGVKLLLLERILGLYGYVIVFALAYLLIVLFGGGGTIAADNPYIYGLIVAAIVLALPFGAHYLGGHLMTVVRKIIGKGRLPRLEGWMAAFANLLWPKGALRLVVLTLLGVLLWVYSIQMVANSFGMNVMALHLAVVATLVELIRLIPATVQGIGLREGAFAYLLSFFGYNLEQSYVVALAAYMALSVSIILCGPIGQAMAWRFRNEDSQ